MKETDKRIKDYLERAIKILNIGHSISEVMDLGSGTQRKNIIEIAKMIQREELASK